MDNTRLTLFYSKLPAFTGHLCPLLVALSCGYLLPGLSFTHRPLMAPLVGPSSSMALQRPTLSSGSTDAPKERLHSLVMIPSSLNPPPPPLYKCLFNSAFLFFPLLFFYPPPATPMLLSTSLLMHRTVDGKGIEQHSGQHKQCD